MRLLPIDPAAQLAQLQAQSAIALAISYLAMNNDCLTRFANPAQMNEADLRRYYVQASPHRRFLTLIDTLKGTGAELLWIYAGRPRSRRCVRPYDV